MNVSYNYGLGSYAPETLNGGSLVVGESINRYYAIEGGYLYDGGSSSYVSVDVQGAILDAYGKLPIPHFSVAPFATIGISYLHGHASVLGYGANKWEFGYRAGAGVEWQFADHWGARAVGRYQYADFDGLVSNAIIGSIGIIYQF